MKLCSFNVDCILYNWQCCDLYKEARHWYEIWREKIKLWDDLMNFISSIIQWIIVFCKTMSSLPFGPRYCCLNYKNAKIKNVWLRYHNNYLHWSSKKNLPQKENWRQREYTWCTACRGAHVQATLCSHGWLITNESLITPRLVTLCHLSQYKHKQQPSLPLPPVAHISHVNRLEFYCLIVTFLLFVYTQPPRGMTFGGLECLASYCS